MFDPWAHAAHEGIDVVWEALPDPFRGLYAAWPGEGRVIFLDRSLDEVSARCVLAEELGHDATCGHLYPTRWVADQSMRLKRSVSEAKALTWAVQRLMPSEALIPMLQRGTSVFEMAEHFGVLPEFANYRVSLMIADPETVWRAG